MCLLTYTTTHKSGCGAAAAAAGEVATIYIIEVSNNKKIFVQYNNQTIGQGITFAILWFEMILYVFMVNQSYSCVVKKFNMEILMVRKKSWMLAECCLMHAGIIGFCVVFFFC